VRRVSYTLRHTYDEPVEIGSEYVEGDFEDFAGRWRFDDAGEGRTRACLEVRIDPGLPLPRPVLAMVNRRVLRTAVEDLARRLEAA
jgi:ribosome-associated toxin RatA of RatAB toxin-antitoxin module